MSLASLLEKLAHRAVRGMDLGLSPTKAALRALSDPHHSFEAVHIAGTNGKGSVAAMVESIARRAGLRTGLYTSPHLCQFSERIRIHGTPIDDEAFARALEHAMDPALPTLTFFETLTVAAFFAFREAKIDLAIVEVGLGGRLDATNVLPSPLVTAITSIGFDHMLVLGDTLSSIAREKAGILKPNVPAVVGPLADEAFCEIETIARKVGAGSVWRITRNDKAPHSDVFRVRAAGLGGIVESPRLPNGSMVIAPRLSGDHQLENASVATAIALRLTERFPTVRETISDGIATATWPGRFERIRKGASEIILDCAHNVDGTTALAQTLDATLEGSDWSLVFGALLDKNWQGMLAPLAARTSRRFYTEPKGRPPVPVTELCGFAEGIAARNPIEALERALAENQQGTVVVTGSIYLVGEIRGELLGQRRDPVIAL